jgi:exosortase A-associated hydrolase 1
MSYQERAVMFSCDGERLVGVVSLPNMMHGVEKPLTSTGVVIIVGGPQYRAGSHRQFVLLARALAAAGTPVLRFDYRGMGDSTGELHTFENVNDDIAAAISALKTTVPSIKNIALWGLCDGASAALLYCHATQDARVTGLCLLNPWVRSEASLAKTQVKHYYTQRLRQKEFWVKLLSGKVAVSAANGLVRSVRIAFTDAAPKTAADHSLPYQSRMAQAWMGFQGPMLLILSGNDYTAKEFLEYAKASPAWAGTLAKALLTRHDVPKADHTFSSEASRILTEKQTYTWAQLLREQTNDH